MRGRIRAAGAAALCLPQLTLAEMPVVTPPDFITARYLCERDVEVPVTYVNGPEGGLVVLMVDGRQFTLLQEVSASGVRYGWPSGGANYVWWTKGAEASLRWREAGEETMVLAECKQQD